MLNNQSWIEVNFVKLSFWNNLQDTPNSCFYNLINNQVLAFKTRDWLLLVWQSCSPLRMNVLGVGNVNTLLLQRGVCFLLFIIGRGAFQSQVDHICFLGGAGLCRREGHRQLPWRSQSWGGKKMVNESNKADRPNSTIRWSPIMSCATWGRTVWVTVCLEGSESTVRAPGSPAAVSQIWDCTHVLQYPTSAH